MQRSILTLHKMINTIYQTIFKNRHGRKIYIQLKRAEDEVEILCCFYIDRPKRNGEYPIPLKWQTKYCQPNNLLCVIERELDKDFYDMEYQESGNPLNMDQYIDHYLAKREQYKFLILVKKAPDTCATRLKNRAHRAIYFEIQKLDNGTGLVVKCHYYDRCYKRNHGYITPAGLRTIFFDYSKEAVLKIVNEELNCDFTDIIITEDTFSFADNSIPICGSI